MERKIIQRGVRLTVGQDSALRELAKQHGCKPNAILGYLLDNAAEQTKNKPVTDVSGKATVTGSKQ